MNDQEKEVKRVEYLQRAAMAWDVVLERWDEDRIETTKAVVAEITDTFDMNAHFVLGMLAQAHFAEEQFSANGKTLPPSTSIILSIPGCYMAWLIVNGKEVGE